MWLCLLQVVSLSEDKMSVDLNSGDMQKWKDSAKQKQQEYCDSTHIVEWRDCKLSDTSNLQKLIVCALFDVSEEEPVKTFTDKQWKSIKKIFVSIKNYMKKHENENFHVSVLFVLAKTGDSYMKVPVVKVLKNDINIQPDNNIFIDLCGRVYKNWQDFLKNNTLPECILCYSKNGLYSAVNDVVEVEYGISPAGKTEKKVFKILDFGSTALGVGATAIGISTVFTPVALPVVVG
jgi:hypothetical protein